MKKEIAKQLNKFADELPIVYTPEPITILLTGYELNRSGYGEVKKFDENKTYEVPFIQLRAVEHKQQIKDAYKIGGVSQVKQYVNSVIQSIQ
jgi:hypothetical protein